jgi:hypothetical protein
MSRQGTAVSCRHLSSWPEQPQLSPPSLLSAPVPSREDEQGVRDLSATAAVSRNHGAGLSPGIRSLGPRFFECPTAQPVLQRKGGGQRAVPAVGPGCRKSRPRTSRRFRHAKGLEGDALRVFLAADVGIGNAQAVKWKQRRGRGCRVGGQGGRIRHHPCGLRLALDPHLASVASFKQVAQTPSNSPALSLRFGSPLRSFEQTFSPFS